MRVRCRCPLHCHGCKWTGDYSEVQSHLTNSTEHLGGGNGSQQRSAQEEQEEPLIMEVPLPSQSEVARDAVSSLALDDSDDAARDSLSSSACVDDVYASLVDSEDEDEGLVADEVASAAATARAAAAKRKRLSLQVAQEACEQRARLASALKQEGDAKYSAKAFREAEALYSKALTLDSSLATLWANRGACRFMKSDWAGCEHDCLRATRLDPSLGNAHVRVSRSRVESGDFEAAAAYAANAACDLERRSAAAPEDSALADARRATRVEARRVQDLIRHVTAAELAVWTDEGGSGSELAGARSFFATALVETRAPRVVLGLAWAELRLGRVYRRSRRLNSQGHIRVRILRVLCV